MNYLLTNYVNISVQKKVKNILFSQDKPSSMEEGRMWHQLNNEGSTFKLTKPLNNCNRPMHILKMILYVELIFFIAWCGWISISHHNGGERYNSVNRPSIENNMETAIKCRGEMCRMKRNVEEVELNRETCKRAFNGTIDKINLFVSEIIIGEATDSVVNASRTMFVNLIQNLFDRKIIPWLGYGNIDEKWQTLLHTLDDEMTEISGPTGDSRSPGLVAYSPLSQDSKNKLREILGPLPQLWRECRRAMGLPEIRIDREPIFTVAELKASRNNCTRGLNVTEEKSQILATMISPGEASDTLVATQRQTVGTLIASIVTDMRKAMPDKSQIANVTDDEWRSKSLKLKHDVLLNSTNSDNQQNTDVDPSTQQMAEYLRDIIVWKIIEYPYCDTLLTNLALSGNLDDEDSREK